jgi:BirA family biotin operon repressor/biotin-[acetyl-CoA-carboxylase] ligase
VGIGINVNQEKFPSELAATSTSLRLETGKTQSRLEVLVQFLRQFENDYKELLSTGAAGVVKRFEAVSSYARGKRVRVTNGNDTFTGVTDGLEDEGLLRVNRDDGRVSTVIAGEVTEVR